MKHLPLLALASIALTSYVSAAPLDSGKSILVTLGDPLSFEPLAAATVPTTAEIPSLEAQGKVSSIAQPTQVVRSSPIKERPFEFPPPRGSDLPKTQPILYDHRSPITELNSQSYQPAQKDKKPNLIQSLFQRMNQRKSKSIARR